MFNFRYIITVILLLLPVQVYSLVNNNTDFPVRISLQDFGLYQLLDKSSPSFNADVTAGYASVIQTRLLHKTTSVPLKKGQVFGFNYSIEDGSANDEWIPVVIHIQHPATNNYLGHQTTGFTTKSYARLKNDGRYHNGAFYVLSEMHEMVQGEWLICVTYGDELVLSKVFNVY